MRGPKRSALFGPTLLLALAGHATMGIALGLAFSLVLLAFDAFGVKPLIAHSADPQSAMVVLAGTFTSALAVGTTMTGFVLTMMDRDKRSIDQ